MKIRAHIQSERNNLGYPFYFLSKSFCDFSTHRAERHILSNAVKVDLLKYFCCLQLSLYEDKSFHPVRESI